VGAVRLVAHPAFPPSARLEVDAELSGKAFEFTVTGPIDRLLIPPSAPPVRTDELWRHTCFELFVRNAEGEGYFEFNFSPSGAWAAYAFDGYREGMRELEVEAPVIRTARHADRLRIAITSPPFVLSFSKHVPGTRASTSSARTVGLSGILEEVDGTKSYWALAHPPGKPDFHHPACFALELPAPRNP
jgi:hypothetical protein